MPNRSLGRMAFEIRHVQSFEAPADPPFAAVAGIDEAGRGCLAGPVAAAAVMLPSDCRLPGLADSKTLSAAQRAALVPAIRSQALAWGIGVIWQGDIDRINILQATFRAMARAAACLYARAVPALLLVDGDKIIPPHVLTACLPYGRTPPGQTAMVRGDALDPRIAAASVLAKTFRDNIMNTLHKRYPAYGFIRHKGYGVAEHRRALAAHGPCPLHRMTFAGVSSSAVLPDAAPVQGRLP